MSRRDRPRSPQNSTQNKKESSHARSYHKLKSTSTTNLISSLPDLPPSQCPPLRSLNSPSPLETTIPTSLSPFRAQSRGCFHDNAVSYPDTESHHHHHLHSPDIHDRCHWDYFAIKRSWLKSLLCHLFIIQGHMGRFILP